MTRDGDLRRVPHLDTTGCARVARQRFGRGAVYLGNVGWAVIGDEPLDPLVRRDERSCKVSKWCAAHDDNEGNLMGQYGLEFVRLVPDPLVVSDGDPTTFTNESQPLLVRRVGSKMLIVSLNLEARFLKNGGELPGEVAVREVDRGQAVCS